jgi:uncharacterized membrane protein YsdA (DUF1294 family)
MVSIRKYPRRLHFAVAFGLTLAITLGLWWGLGGRFTWPVGLGCWLVAINVVTFGYYGYDKGKAEEGSRRVPEVVLHSLSGLGGSPGALAAMKLFRHKTIKGPFRVVFWAIVLLQLALIAWLIKLTWWS